jgi:hypothetical protein
MPISANITKEAKATFFFSPAQNKTNTFYNKNDYHLTSTWKGRATCRLILDEFDL